ncbi:MAG TPA: CidA/LrgA family protein [Ottowia sp.]|uniref:CidA/LrgA family protein n=1 Tax=Ottowia sp. TaxID=1898956 RepID=UPI002C497285|nr:CidA/LrgA family protein [Ottowia sp.]HMN20755.1 CidA/LrgA family protein [Ottowia sp.]
MTARGRRALHVAGQGSLGLAVLVLAQLAGQYVVTRWQLTIPAALVGMALLLALLMALGRVPGPVALVADGLLRHMMLILMPAVAGIMDHFALLREHWLGLLAAGILGTLLTMALTAGALRLALARSHAPPRA